MLYLLRIESSSLIDPKLIRASFERTFFSRPFMKYRISCIVVCLPSHVVLGMRTGIHPLIRSFFPSAANSLRLDLNVSPRLTLRFLASFGGVQHIAALVLAMAFVFCMTTSSNFFMPLRVQNPFCSIAMFTVIMVP